MLPGLQTEAQRRRDRAGLIFRPVKKAIKSLSDAKLITEVKTIGETRYAPLLTEDVRRSLLSGLSPRLPGASGESLGQGRSSLRTILKGLEPTAEIIEFETIHTVT